MRVALSQNSSEYHAWSIGACDVQPTAEVTPEMSSDNSIRSSFISVAHDGERESSVESQQSKQYRLHQVLAVLPSLDIQRDRHRIIEDLDKICSADHLYMHQTRNLMDISSNEFSTMSADIVLWLCDLLLKSNSISDIAILRLVCKLLERLTFSSARLSQEATNILTDSNMMSIILRVGLQSGAHTECFNILTYCVGSMHNNDSVKFGATNHDVDTFTSSRRASLDLLCSSVYFMAQDVTYLEPEAFTCALHFFLGELVQPSAKYASPSPLLSPSNSTPISKFIKSILDPLSLLSSEPNFIRGQQSVTGTVPITMALIRLMTIVKRVQCSDIKSKTSSRVTLTPQKFADYRLLLLPLGALTQCLQSPDPSGRIGALKVLLGLIPLHPLHAGQIGGTESIMTFLLIFAQRRLSLRAINVPPVSMSSAEQDKLLAQGHLEAEDAYIFRLLSALSHRDRKARIKITSTITLKAILLELVKRITCSGNSRLGLLTTDVDSSPRAQSWTWNSNSNSNVKGKGTSENDNLVFMDDLSIAIFELASTLSADSPFDQKEDVKKPLDTLNKSALRSLKNVSWDFGGCFSAGIKVLVPQVWNTYKLCEMLIPLNCNLAHLTGSDDGVGISICEAAVFLFQKEQDEEDSSESFSLLTSSLLMRLRGNKPQSLAENTSFCSLRSLEIFFKDLSRSLISSKEHREDKEIFNGNGIFHTAYEKIIPRKKSSEIGSVMTLISQLGPEDHFISPLRNPTHLDNLIHLGGVILSDWSVSWPHLPTPVVRTMISYMLHVSRSEGSSVNDFLGFLFKGAERDKGKVNSARMSMGTESEYLLVAQRLSHSLAAILTGGKVTIHVPIKVQRSEECEERSPFSDCWDNAAERGYLNRSSRSSSSSSINSSRMYFGSSDDDDDYGSPRQPSSPPVFRTGDSGPSSPVPRVPCLAADRILRRSSGSSRTLGSVSDRVDDKTVRRTVYATKIVEQHYTTEILRCSRSLLCVVHLLTDVMVTMGHLSSESKTTTAAETVNDRSFDYTAVVRFLLGLLGSVPKIDTENCDLKICVASIDCLSALSNYGASKWDSFLPGSSAYYSSTARTLSQVHSAVVTNLPLIASQLDRVGSRVLGPALRLVTAVSTTLKLAVLKDETCCAALVRLIIAGLMSDVRTKNADSAAAEACSAIISIGKVHPEAVKAVLSRSEVEEGILRVIQAAMTSKKSSTLNPSAHEIEMQKSDVQHLYLALEAMTVMADCYNSAPFFIFDPSWSMLTPDRCMMGHFPHLRPHTASESGSLKKFTGPIAVEEILRVYFDAGTQSSDQLILLMVCYNCASALLLTGLRMRSPQSTASLRLMRKTLVTVLFPLLPLSLEAAFLPQFNASHSPNKLNGVDLQTALSCGTEEGAGLLVGSAMHFISVLILYDIVFSGIVEVQCPTEMSEVQSEASVFDFFSQLETPSWAVGKPFRNLFSKKMPTFKEWDGVMRVGSSNSSVQPVSAIFSATGSSAANHDFQEEEEEEERPLPGDSKRANCLLQIVLHIMDAPVPGKEDACGIADTCRHTGWTRDNQMVQLRGMELLSSMAMSGVDCCECPTPMPNGSGSTNTCDLAVSLRRNSFSAATISIAESRIHIPKRRSTITYGVKGCARAFPVMGSELSYGVVPVPRALSALCIALTSGSTTKGHREKYSPLALTARGARLRRTFVIALKAIIQTSKGLGCDVIVQSEAHKWLFLILRTEAERVAPKPPVKARKESMKGHVAWELCRSEERDDGIIPLGFGEEPLTSVCSTAALCCQVVTLLASAGFANSLCQSGMAEAVLCFMSAHSHVPRAQLEGLIALVEMLSSAPEYLNRLLTPVVVTQSIFDEEPMNKNPFASKSPRAPPSPRDIAQSAADSIAIALDAIETDTDMAAEERTKQLRKLLLRHKKLGLDQESCNLS